MTEIIDGVGGVADTIVTSGSETTTVCDWQTTTGLDDFWSTVGGLASTTDGGEEAGSADTIVCCVVVYVQWY